MSDEATTAPPSLPEMPGLPAAQQFTKQPLVKEPTKETKAVSTPVIAHTKVIQYPTFMDILHTARDVAIEEAHAHVREQGQNLGPRIEQYQAITGGSPGDSYCDDFVSWCELTGFAKRMDWHTDIESMLTHVGLFGKLYMPISGYCPATWQAAVHRGYARDHDYHPDSGDLILFDFHQVGEPHHIGVVLFEDHNGIIKTVEGNTSSGEGTGSQDNGDGVFIRYRQRRRIHGFIHGHKKAP